MNEEQMVYDVFVSYRRDGGSHYARMLDLGFRLMGVRPFFDREELKNGYFDEKIYRNIERSKYFLFVLSPGALKRCNEGPNDWVRKELVKALEENKQYKDGRKIVVVSPEKEFLWPVEMPTELDDLRRIQGKCIDFESDSFGNDLRKLIHECLIGVQTDEDRRAAEMERKTNENDFSARALFYWTNDGKIDDKEQKDLADLARAYKIDDAKRDELIQKAKSQYESNQREIDKRLGRRFKRFIIRVGILIAVLAVVYGIAWYRGYLAGKSVETGIRKYGDQAAVALSLSSDTKAVKTDSPVKSEKEVVVNESVESEEDEPDNCQAQQYTSTLRIPCFQNVFKLRSIDEAKDILGNGGWNGIYTSVPDSDFRHILGFRYRDTSLISGWTTKDEERIHNDPITKEILRQVDFARQEPLKLLEAGMRVEEIKSARPDLVMRLADIRVAARELINQLIAAGKHLEALAKYESAVTAFKYCDMSEFERPDFSQATSVMASPAVPKAASPAAPRAARAVGARR